MFSLPWRKSKKNVIDTELNDVVHLDWLDQFMVVENKLPFPDWELIAKFVDENQHEKNQDQLWSDIARSWLHSLGSSLAHDYIKTETENFILLSSKNQRYNKLLITFLERCRKRLLSRTKGIFADEGLGKHVVIAFENLDSYYDYISHYGPQEGTYGLSSGMYLNYGYGHFVFQGDDLSTAESIAAHEMTHALLSHLPIPMWLNEGIAVNMESLLGGYPPERLDRSMAEQHQDFWTSKTIQQFWTGESFFRPDDGQKLSYQLAQILVAELSTNYDTFSEFANSADWRNAGENAFLDIYDLSLGDMVANFLGDGDWSPRPDEWPIQ